MPTLSPFPLIDFLHSRRSFKSKVLGQPYPDDRLIETFVAAALTAADHGVLRPWRFIHIGEQGRTRLESAFEAAAREADADAPAEVMAAARKKAFDCPCMLAAIAVIDPDHPYIPESEQWIAVGAALQNFLLAVHAHGYAGAILSGKRVRSRALRRTLSLADHEYLVGFIPLGTPTVPAKPRQSGDIGDHLRDWPPAGE
ncbi:MAG: nitroreductase [Alphaproteobacteria bacterium]|nr:nitroreductase [Alphaproteobacteria bacterium]